MALAEKVCARHDDDDVREHFEEKERRTDVRAQAIRGQLAECGCLL